MKQNKVDGNSAEQFDQPSPDLITNFIKKTNCQIRLLIAFSFIGKQTKTFLATS